MTGGSAGKSPSGHPSAGQDFSGQWLQGYRFTGEDLSGANFSGAHIRGTHFAGAILEGASFQGAIAGASFRTRLLGWLLWAMTSATLGLLGIAVADTVNTNYLYYLGPRDAIATFGTLLVFTLVLLAWDLLTAIVTTMLGALLVWVVLFAWEFRRMGDFVDALLDQDSLVPGVITTIITFWAAFSVIPAVCGLVTASTYFQRNVGGSRPHRSAPTVPFVRRALRGPFYWPVRSLTGRSSLERWSLLSLLLALATAAPGAVGHAGALAKFNSLLDTGLLWFLSLRIAQRLRQEKPQYQWLRSGALALAAWGGTCFRRANLTGADFSGAILNAADFSGAQLTHTKFQQARYLDFARAGQTLLQQRRVRQLLVIGHTEQAAKPTAAQATSRRDRIESNRTVDFRECNLHGAYLVGADLRNTDFTNADLSQADLSGAQLTGAILTRAQAIGTCFRGAEMTSCCLESWNIDTTTELDGVECAYVYLLSGQRERRPSDGYFQPGDFTKLFEDVLHTVDLIFRQGLDISAFTAAFQQVQREGQPLSIRSIENKGDGMVVVKVEVSQQADKARLQRYLSQQYEKAIQQIENRYQAELSAKDEQLTIYREQHQAFARLTQLLTQQPLSQRAQVDKRVVLKLGEPGQLGLPVTLEIGPESALPQLETQGWLPSPELPLAAQQRWQRAYEQIYQQSVRIDAPQAQVTNISYQELIDQVRQCDRILHQAINHWLDSETFRPLREALLTALDPGDSVRLIWQCDRSDLRALPLHLWHWFDRYPRAETVLSKRTYHQIPPASKSKLSARLQGETARDPSLGISQKVRILAILGDSQGLDVHCDRTLLSALPDVALTSLVEPTRPQLNDYLWEQPWEILFFAGHSSYSDHCQQLRINPAEGLSLSDLKHSLRKAIDHGLRLAIFNACDGLKLIDELSDELSLPPTIVMRHPVPDPVAQAFLKHFLRAFAAGVPLHQAVREAREQLQGLESQFPFASWLPVLCQNAAAPSLTWPQLKQIEIPEP